MIDSKIVALFDQLGTRLDAPVHNYYGTPTLVRLDSRWLLGLATEFGASFVEVSESFAAAWLAEFDPLLIREDGKEPLPPAKMVRAEALRGLAAPWPEPDSVDFYDPELDAEDREKILAEVRSALG